MRNYAQKIERIILTVSWSSKKEKYQEQSLNDKYRIGELRSKYERKWKKSLASPRGFPMRKFLV